MRNGCISIVCFGVFSALSANQALFYAPDGDQYLLDITSPAAVSEVKETLQDVLGCIEGNFLLESEGEWLEEEELFFPYPGQEVWIEADPCDECEPSAKKTSAGYRDFFKPVTESEKKDLHFIMKTMATKSLTSLLKYKSQLEAAGERIDHIHPLRFLETVFSDEELKVYLHNIRKGNSWIKGEFFKGIKNSLQEEMNLGNLTDEMVFDFCFQFEIDPNLLLGHIHNHKWDDLIKTLIVHIPREGDSDRYDQ
jgi:hypothetical protein